MSMTAPGLAQYLAPTPPPVFAPGGSGVNNAQANALLGLNGGLGSGSGEFSAAGTPAFGAPAIDYGAAAATQALPQFAAPPSLTAAAMSDPIGPYAGDAAPSPYNADSAAPFGTPAAPVFNAPAGAYAPPAAGLPPGAGLNYLA